MDIKRVLKYERARRKLSFDPPEELSVTRMATSLTSVVFKPGRHLVPQGKSNKRDQDHSCRHSRENGSARPVRGPKGESGEESGARIVAEESDEYYYSIVAPNLSQ